MKRSFLSIMALCLCAVMSFAGITLPYTEDFEGYGKTVTYTVGTGTTAAAQGYVNHWSKVKVPTGWTVGNKQYSNVTSESPNNGITTATHRQYVPYVCTNGTGASANPTTGYADKATTYKNATSGYNALRLYPSTTTYAPAWAAMPELDASVDLQKVVITFNAKMANSTGYSIFVGMSPTANYNAETIVKVGEVGPGKGLSTTGSTVYDAVAAEIKLNNYEGTGRYIIFYTNPSTAAVNAFIDDIYVYQAACDAPVPSVAGITDKTAAIAIDITEGYYDIKVMEGAVAAKDVEDAQGTLYEGVNQRPYYINDLQANKQYTVAARMWCDQMGETMSVWKTISFKTLCQYATMDAEKVYYQTGFEASEGYMKGSALATKVLPCWNVGNVMDPASTSYSPYVNGAIGVSQDADANNYYLNMGISSSITKNYAVLPAITPANNDWSKILLTFKMSSSSDHRKVKVGIMNNPYDGTTFKEIAEVELKQKPTNTVSGWTSFDVTFENYDPNQGFTGNCIAFMMDYELSAASTIYLDDIVISEAPDCLRPNSLDCPNVGVDTCALTWNGRSEQYLVKWATEKVADKDKAAYTNWVGTKNVTGKETVITGLNPNTLYYFTIMSVCGESVYSDYSAGMLAVRTECPETFNIPYFNDFNTNSASGSGKNADCWTGLQITRTSTSSSFPQVNPNKGVLGTGDFALKMNSSIDTTYTGYYVPAAGTAGTYSRTYAITPKLNVNSLSNYLVRFSITNDLASNTSYTYKTGLVVGVTTNNDETKIEQNFIPLDTINYEGVTYVSKRVDLSRYASKIPAEAKYIVLKSDPRAFDFVEFGGKVVKTNTSSVEIDNFEVIEIPCCMDPEITIGATTYNSAQVSILPYRTTDKKWELVAIPQADDQGDMENIPSSAKYFTTETTNYTMTDLTPSTKYNVYARTVCASCGTDVKSEWSSLAVLARTKYYFAENYLLTFDTDEDSEMTSGSSPSASYVIHPALQYGLTNSTSEIPSCMYKPYNVKNATSSQYAKDGDAALRIVSQYSGNSGQAAPSYNHGGYVIFPALDDCQAQNRSVRFNYRMGYNYPLDYSVEASRGKMQGQYANVEVLFGLVPLGTTTPTDENFSLIETLKPANNTDKFASPENDMLWETMIYNITQNEATTMQVCIWYKQTHTSDQSRYFIVDNFQITEAINFEIPTLTSVIPTDVTVNVAWEEMTNAVNVYVYDGDTKVSEVLNVTDNKATVTGLSANKTYIVKVVDATAPAAMFNVAAASREITTECDALVVTDENPALFTFDSDYGPAYPSSTTASDANYLWPNCWTIVNNGTAGASTLKGYNWIIQRQGYSYMSSPTASTTYDNYNFGMKDAQGNATNSLRLNGTTTATYQTAYAALPRVKGNLNEYVLDFYFRPASLNMGTGKLASVSTEKKFYVVAMSDVNDLSTADTLYTVEYPVPDSIKTTTLAANDPEGLEYWREFVVPLCGAKADDRIAFVQAGDQACYLFIDNVQIRKQGANEIFIPNNLDAENITKESATLTWESCNVGASYLLTVLEGEVEILMDQSVNGLSYNLTGLTANTNYTFYVKAAKGEATSDESPKFSFNTACPTYGVDDFKFSFEEDENLIQQTGATSATMLQNSCWIYENLGSTQTVSSTYFPYNHKDVFDSKTKEKTNTFSHSGDYCLELYASRGTTSATPTALGRVITPEIDNAAQIFSQKVLKFYYRAIYHNSKNLTATTSSNGPTYGRGVIVGVCSDPNDEKTFQTLDTLYYTLNPTSADMTEENDYAWMKGFVKLDQAVGNHIWMMPLLKDTAAKVLAYGRMYIDDISFSDPMPILTTAVNDQTMGKVTAGDAYDAGALVTVEATPNYNYRFVEWSDGSTENPYLFTMPANDLTLTANFAPKAITVSELEGESFENETAEGDVRWVLVPGSSSDTYRQIAGWTYGNAGTSTSIGTYWSYNWVNTTTYGYAQEGNCALRVVRYVSGTTYDYQSFAVTPKISDMANLAGKQMQFYMRPLHCYSAEYATTPAKRNQVYTTYASDTYSKGVIVGTCSNPKDITTFHPLKTVYYSRNVTTSEFATEANNYLWEKQAIVMKDIPADDEYIYIMAADKNADGATKNCYMYIDSIFFTVAQPVITVEANNPNYGTVTGSGSYDEGTEITITSEAKYNHEFVQWNDGNTDASRTITVEGDATYTAEFAISKFNAVDINETFEAEEGGVQRWTLLPGTTTVNYKATEAWTYGNIGTGSVGGSWPYNVTSTSSTTTYSYQGDYAAKLYAYSTTYCGYIVTPKIEDYATAFDDAQFSFYMKPTYHNPKTGKETVMYIGANYAKTVIVGVATDPTDVSTFTPVDTITYNVPGLSGTTLANASADNNYNWEKVTVSLKNNKAPYVYIMASKTDATGKSYNYDYMYIDNISFIAPVTVTVETEDALKGSAVVVGDATVEAGQNVTIKAVPEDTYVFNAWKQGETVVSNDAEYTFALTKNETYTATFKKDTLTIQVTTEGNGTVNINGAGTEAKVEKYTSLTLNAVANQGYQFVQWSDGNQDNPRQVSATEDKIYTAEFAAASVKVLVYVDAESAGMGAVAATGEGPAVNMYYVGKTVTMTATANEGYVFVKWNDGNTDNPRQITASAEVTYYASFKRDKAVVRNGLTSGRYYTLCESQKLTEIEGAIFFQPESWDGSRLVLAEVEEVKAGYGYMFQATSDKVLAVLTGDAVAAPVDAQVAKNGMQGTAFSGITNLPEGNDYCGIMNNHLQYFGANNTMIAKRAYVIFSAIGDQKAPASARRISMTTSGSNVATMLDNVRFDDDEAAAKFIIDGQLIIMKGGKMYNAQGQEL